MNVIDLTVSDDELIEPALINTSSEVLVSIDVGSINLAFACVEKHTGKVLKWAMCEQFSHCQSINPREVAIKAFNVVNMILEGLNHNDCIAVIESQPPIPTRGREMTVYRNAIIETALHSAFESLGIEHRRISPCSVRAFYRLPKGYIAKKAAAIQIVQEMIDDMVNINSPNETPHYIFVPALLRQYFQESHKQDDLSDCLLQAIFVCSQSSHDS